MSDTITLTGIVATPPRSLTTAEGLAITSFRLASTQRRFDRASDRWVDADTNWYTVTTYRQLATNAGVSLHKGERIVVTGRLRVRNWETGEKSGTSIEVDAEALGHDLAWGTAAFSRSTGSAPVETLATEALSADARSAEALSAEAPSDDADLVGASASDGLVTPF